MEQRASFSTAAKLYDETRPSYPDEVIDWIIDKTSVSKMDRLLEIGPGTGQATLKFAKRGYRIHCVEMGESLAELLLEKSSDLDVSVDVSTFEDWQPKEPFQTSFIFCATAFHWIDSRVKYKKCYELLNENGYLVLLWHFIPNTDSEEVNKAYELLWEYYPKKQASVKSLEDVKLERKHEIADSGYFTLEHYLDYKWKLVESKERLLQSFFAQSSFLSLDKNQQASLSSKVRDLYETLEAVIETEIHTTVYVAKRIAREFSP